MDNFFSKFLNVVSFIAITSSLVFGFILLNVRKEYSYLLSPESGKSTIIIAALAIMAILCFVSIASRYRISKLTKQIYSHEATIRGFDMRFNSAMNRMKKEKEKIVEDKNKEIRKLEKNHKQEMDSFEKKSTQECKSAVGKINHEMFLLKQDYEKKIKDLTEQISSLSSLVEKLNEHRNSSTPFRLVSDMISDYETAVFDKEEERLANPPYPAPKAAETVRELRRKYREQLFDFKQMKYKYDFLLGIFPELNIYLEDDDSLIKLDRFDDLDSFDEERDRAHDWLTNDEYNNLSDVEKNQLALDRYNKRKKGNWEIGIEYELYIGYLLRSGNLLSGEKLIVDQFGERNGLQDLGRDIIAHRINKTDQKETYIIQCKRWSNTRVIHENVICQLFGTALEYKLSHKGLFEEIVIPVFVTTTNLSLTAQEFANALGVKVIIKEMGDYPMIKCNIDSMKYHLPFDQQYHTTQIIETHGEFYAWTVKEAVEKGYTRARRHLINQ